MKKEEMLAKSTKKQTRKPSPNDQRSNALNPDDPAHKATADNRSRQMNPKDQVYPKLF